MSERDRPDALRRRDLPKIGPAVAPLGSSPGSLDG
jgi:hypothetical protein